MIKHPLRLVLPVFLLGGLLAWAARYPKEKTPLGSELARAPAAARQRKNPYVGRPEAVLAGKNLYQRHCAQCHGDDGKGRNKAPDLHAPVVQESTAGALFWFLKNGNLKKGMPSWSRLPDQQVWQLVSYLQMLH